MSFHKKFLSSSILSVIDQGLLSALNFLIGALLIRLVAKDDYGLYGQLYVGGLLAGLLVDSWIAGPLTTVTSVVSENTRRHLLRTFWTRQIFWTLVMAAIAFLVVEFIPAATHYAEKSWGLGAAFGLYVIGNGLREYGRTVGFIQSAIPQVLRQDVVYVLLVLTGLTGLLYFEYLALLPLFLVLSGASLLAALYGRSALMQLTATQAAIETHDQETLQAHQETIRSHGRWAVAGALVGWLSNYSYVYLSGAMLGAAAIADLNAARLLLMPIPLAVAAWIRVARPVAGRLMQEHNWTGLRKLTLMSVLGIEAVVLCFVGVLLLAMPWLQTHFIDKNKYAGLDLLIMLWGAYFAVNAVRTIGTSWLMSGGAFRSMFKLGVVTLVLVIAITTLTMPYLASAGAIVALICVEVFETVVVWRFILPSLRRQAENALANG
ncbi:hypothetical protein H8K47_02050 [Undibacterium sp. CY7W]|uniref:Membrane protein involved in the export of O-antigen and teichoic acid n=1 Tax=Undibacterium rugosum TaxID=2762291 RepID=A0A923HXT3_9BURK|nr:hypothetical protein [Undibacterium rugosum]MBC3934133.1 hypothetical protein [Undibacterium rugosum]